MKKKKLNLSFNKETISNLQMNETKGGATFACTYFDCYVSNECTELPLCQPSIVQNACNDTRDLKCVSNIIACQFTKNNDCTI